MGTHKVLLPLGGEPMVARVAHRVLASSSDEVLVVLGREAEAVRAALRDTAVRFVENPRYLEGMGGSFRVALDALAPDVGAAMFVLADQPLVSTEMFDALLAAYRRTKPLAVVSRFGGIVAPPHVFDRALFAELGLPGSEGAKGVLQRYADRFTVLDFPSDALMDVDNPEDYRRVRAIVDGT